MSSFLDPPDTLDAEPGGVAPSAPSGTEPASLDPSARDPACALAAELRATFVQPVRERILEGLRVLQELGDLTHRLEDDWAVDAFTYALVEVLAREIPAPPRSHDRLLQTVAAGLYWASQGKTRLNRQFFWTFLNELSGRYRQPAGTGKRTLIGILNALLAHYGLGGTEDRDVVSGMYRLVVPLIHEARGLLQDRAHLLIPPPAATGEPGRSDQPPTDFPASNARATRSPTRQ